MGGKSPLSPRAMALRLGEPGLLQKGDSKNGICALPSKRKCMGIKK